MISNLCLIFLYITRYKIPVYVKIGSLVSYLCNQISALLIIAKVKLASSLQEWWDFRHWNLSKPPGEIVQQSKNTQGQFLRKESQNFLYIRVKPNYPKRLKICKAWNSLIDILFVSDKVKNSGRIL